MDISASAALDPGSENQPDPVIGSNVFWAVLVLCITSAWHPLGSSIGFPDETRRYARIFPLTALLDSVLLYAEFVVQLLDKRQNTVRDAARRVAINRLRAGLPDYNEDASPSHPSPEDSGRREGRAQLTNKVWLKAMILFIGLDIRARLLGDALAVLLYAKMYGYSGTPVSLTIATVYFASWLANEVFLFLAYGIFWADNARELMDMVDEIVTVRSRPALSTLKMVDQALLLAQTIAFLAAGVWIIVSRPKPATSGQPTSSFSFSGMFEAILDIYGSILRPMTVPVQWWHQKMMGGVCEKYANMGAVPRLLLLFPFLMLLFGMALVFLALAVPMLTVHFCVVFSPFVFLPVIFKVVQALSIVVYEFVLSWRRVPPVFWARAGGLIMLVAMVVYYEVLWVSDGTSKAPWTEHLG